MDDLLQGEYFIILLRSFQFFGTSRAYITQDTCAICVKYSFKSGSILARNDRLILINTNVFYFTSFRMCAICLYRSLFICRRNPENIQYAFL